MFSEVGAVQFIVALGAVQFIVPAFLASLVTYLVRLRSKETFREFGAVQFNVHAKIVHLHSKIGVWKKRSEFN